MKVITEYRQANDSLNKKHILTEYKVKFTLENMNMDFDNVMYVAKKEAWRFLETPVTNTMVERAKTEGLLIAEIPFKGYGTDFNRALIEAANKVQERLGQVNLSDVADIEEASKAEIRRLKTRFVKSTSQPEIEARKAELEYLISAYEDKESDTERDDFAEHWANIRECLEQALQSIENDKVEDAISELDDAIMAI